MLLIWRGWGLLTVLNIVIVTVIGILGSASLANALGMSRLSDFGLSVGLIAAAVVNWKIGCRFNNPEKDRVVIDQNTNQEILLKNRHTLFFINMQYWSIPVLIIGLVTLFLALKQIMN